MDRVKEPDGVQSLDELCRAYYGPVVFYLRRCGCSEDDAQDLAQEFFRDFLARDGFSQARRGKGKFRKSLYCRKSKTGRSKTLKPNWPGNF